MASAARRTPRPDWLAALLIACGLLVFVPNLNAYFLSDDFVLLSWTRVHSAGDVLAFFDPRTFWFYRPLVKVFYWAGQGLFGLHAAPFHLFSLVLHGANAFLVYLLVAHGPDYPEHPSRARWAAGVAAGLLFLLNGHHAETVSWIAAVGDLSGTFCILSALVLFRRYCAHSNLAFLGGSLALFAVGLLSRETAMVLPALVLLDVLAFRVGVGQLWRRERAEALRAPASPSLPPLRPLLLALGGYALVLAGYLALQALGNDKGQITTARGGLQFRALNVDSVLLGIMDYVHGLAPGGSLLAGMSLDTLRIVVWVEWAVIVLLAVALWRVRRTALFGLGWLLITPLVFVFFSTGPTDRYFYLPSIGYSIAAAALLTSLPPGGFQWRRGRDKSRPYDNASVGARFIAPSLGVLALGALLVTQGLDLAAREGAWKTAGQATGGVLHDVRQAAPDPRDYSAFYFVDLPPVLNGVPAFQNGLQESIQLVYDNRTLAGSAVTCDYLRKQAELPRYSLFFRFKGDGVEQFLSREDCHGTGSLPAKRIRNSR